MEFKPLSIEGLVLVTPRVFEDERGLFMESFNERDFAEHGIRTRFVQDNQSTSKKGVLRGLHFQRPPHAQDKLVRVTRGEALDVAVDIRSGSPTFGAVASVRLSGENRNALYIPKGFAHGFVALTDDVDFEYKVSDFWDAASEGGIRWSDPALKIDWSALSGMDPASFIIVAKDRALPALEDANGVF
jgi:dTDP-4-dehydrorhamnose 3,5-epimerase